MQSNAALLRSDVGSTDKLMGNNNNLNNNGSPGAHIMFPMEDEGLTQLGSVFQSAYQSIVDGGPQVSDRGMPSVIYRVICRSFIPENPAAESRTFNRSIRLNANPPPPPPPPVDRHHDRDSPAT